MRLFIAVNFSESVRSRLLELRDGLRSRSEGGNFSLPENLHLTLAFLGEYDTKGVSDAKAAMNAVRFEPFPLTIDRLGRFGRGGGVWWAGLREEPALMELQGCLSDCLADAGFELERRKYSPHVTLGREVVTDAEPGPIEPFGEICGRVELMKSERIRGRLTYTAVYSKKAQQ